MAKKRRFGRVRKLASGRYQARYHGPDGIDRPAPYTFASKTDAERWLTRVEADIIAGTWRDPNRGRVPLGPYLTEWIAHRTGIRVKTVELYRWLYRKCIEPAFKDRHLGDITPGQIRAWHAQLLADGVSATTAAKAYRLLRAVLNTAVDDELIRRNPCRIKGAGSEPTPERPAATVAQVLDLAERVPGRYRALILLAAFTGLRYGELAALRRRHLGPKATSVTVAATVIEPKDGPLYFGPPKSAAGRRTVTIPTAIRGEIQVHLATYVTAEPEALVFTSSRGTVLRRSNFQRATRWTATVRAAGLPGFHLHDLRHTGNTLAADTGASLRSLMARMGHSSTRAALIYQHTGTKADAAIADALSKQIHQHRAHNGHAAKKRRKK